MYGHLLRVFKYNKNMETFDEVSISREQIHRWMLLQSTYLHSCKTKIEDRGFGSGRAPMDIKTFWSLESLKTCEVP